VPGPVDLQVMQVQPTPGWYSDPWRAAPLRWWDGVQWTDRTYQPAFPPVATDTLARARTDLRGGGIALLGFVGANLLGLGCALLAGVFGVPARSVGAAVFGLFGLWTGLTLTAYVITHRREGGTLADVGFAWPTGRELAKGFGTAFLAVLAAAQVALALRSFLPHEDTGIRTNLFLSHRPSTAAIIVLAAAACIGAPIVEELFFRGIVQTILAGDLGMSAAVVVQAALFGLAHYQLGMTADEAVIRIVSIGVVGLFLGWLRARTGRLGAGMAAHATYNVIIVLLTIAALSSA
jgi:membrane protease YdiL (CAAX protease family)